MRSAAWLAAASATLAAVSVRAEDALGAAVASPPAAASARALVVRLAFPADVDLDLYVTDPQEETAYFANTPTRLGGRLDRDVRCGSSGPRIETFVIDPAPPGRYRVGVDFPERCGGGLGDTEFVVRLDAAGRSHVRRQRSVPGRFEAVVLEVTTAEQD